MSDTPIDPEIRKTTPDEIASLTGYSAHMIRRAARAGLLVEMGVIFIPSETSSDGTYMCALKPFLNWFRGEAIVAKQSAHDAAKEISFVTKVSALKHLFDESAA